mmetsp:Transcript_26894/g.58708  ORF Transcript_26894/g.58708 Transcript_26894/m.58708 type:complete len:524 (-) Transcript_26894:194-1765(-)|eukprot:CAMPEP_0202892316 /NCGR_PEP_ID=MMETSP1392-20130828/2045_1 /ASSEMBLY_ACC=CAM_ASM_000868 /TAXON_ID=225041 /ORGANISM="Chlamydomonas chlamydogama, Strain SAG 11-48b" /LENGTH=523 /DNA_ID=CAMNT_0049576213 /DNA_START=113 /DNA_END=1684 /DNA_ORIENTATION=-
MTAVSSSEVLKELQDLVGAESRAISYKWLARQYNLSANAAKRLLYKFADEFKGKVEAMYMVSGWSKDNSHVMQVVRANELEGLRKQLNPLTGLHIYSVAPHNSAGGSALWQIDYQQSQELLRECLEGRNTPSATFFKSNGCSSVKFSAPNTPVSVASKPRPQATLQPSPAKAPAPQAPAPAAASSAGATEASAPDAAAAAVAPASEPQEAPAAGQSPAKGPAKASPPKAKAAGTLASMWNKPQAKKAAAPDPAPASVEAAEQEAPASAMDVDGEGEEGDLTFKVAGAKRGRRAVQLAESDDDEDDRQPVEAAAPADRDAAAGEAAGAQPQAAQKQQKRSGGGGAEEAGSSADQEAGKASGRAGGKRKAKAGAPGTEAAATEPSEQGKGKKRKEKERTADTDAAVLEALEVPAEVPAAREAQMKLPIMTGVTKARVKKLRTTYNEKGEEVTEEVWEDVEGEEAAGNPQAAAHAPAPEAAKAQSAPPSRPSGGKPSGPPIKGSATIKGKAQGAVQNKITSFFTKK